MRGAAISQRMANLMDLANTAVRSVDERMVDGDDGDELRVRKRIRVANDTAPHAKNVQVQSIVDDVFRKIASREGQKSKLSVASYLSISFTKYHHAKNSSARNEILIYSSM